VSTLALKRGYDVTIFDSSRIPTLNSIAGHDVIISFLPGEAFLGYTTMLLESGVPVVTGSTGFEWPMGRDSLHNQIMANGTVWIQSGNFSLGNLALLPVLMQLGKHPAVKEFQPMLQEWHHVHKKDAPSGTALMWRDAFGREAEIRSFREGDIVGIHELILRSDTESIIIRHEVSDRDVFAQGALFLVDFITRNRRDIRSGLYSMQELMDLYKHLH
jgi:4-hydroxy-tetrahydrodipicolinate reductase